METSRTTDASPLKLTHGDMSPHVSSALTVTPPRVNLTDRSWPFVGSFGIHALLFTILLAPVFQHPELTNPAPNIFWFSTLSLPGDSKEPEQPLHRSSVAFTEQNEEQQDQEPSTSENPAPAARPDTATEFGNTGETAHLTVATPVPTVKTGRPEKAMAPQPAARSAKAPLPAASPIRQTVIPPEPEATTHHAPAAPLPALVKPVESQSHADNTEMQGKDVLVRQNSIEQKTLADERLQQEQAVREQAIREQQERAIRDRLERERIAAEKAHQKQLARDNEQQKRKEQAETISRQEMERAASEAAVRKIPPLAARQNMPSPSRAEKKPETPAPPQPVEKPARLALPVIKGDIKLVIEGTILADTSITFREFAPARRDRPFSPAEARKSTKITPLTATANDTTREIVIARTNPGVYTVTAMAGAIPAQVNVTLMLYEGTSRTITRNLGSVAISRRKVICKILMPEGILWDDDSSFSGNLEDSDGVTKFNTVTGLMWKEYSE